MPYSSIPEIEIYGITRQQSPQKILIIEFIFLRSIPRAMM